jgi:hypothetical protein
VLQVVLVLAPFLPHGGEGIFHYYQKVCFMDFDFFYLDGFSWTDLLDFLQVPHYSNEHEMPSELQTKSFDLRTLMVPDPDYDYAPDETLDEDDNEDLLVVWTGERPTDEQVLEKIAELNE